MHNFYFVIKMMKTLRILFKLITRSRQVDSGTQTEHCYLFCSFHQKLHAQYISYIVVKVTYEKREKER